MARSDTITIPANAWTEITNSNATVVTLQVKAGSIQLVATVGSVAPTSFNSALDYPARQGEMGVPITSFAPGTPGVNRLFAWANAAPATLYISHD
jgi:hypothetical protein